MSKESTLQKRIETVFALLQRQSTCVLSTADTSGAVSAAPLYFLATPQLDLYWLSSTSSRHSRNLAATGRVALAVFEPTFAWRSIAGVQMEGRCAVAPAADRELHLPAYCERFHLGSILSVAVAQSTLYRFHPTWVRYIDNGKRFGYRFELDLEPHP